MVHSKSSSVLWAIIFHFFSLSKVKDYGLWGFIYKNNSTISPVNQKVYCFFNTICS